MAEYLSRIRRVGDKLHIDHTGPLTHQEWKLADLRFMKSCLVDDNKARPLAHGFIECRLSEKQWLELMGDRDFRTLWVGKDPADTDAFGIRFLVASDHEGGVEMVATYTGGDIMRREEEFGF